VIDALAIAHESTEALRDAEACKCTVKICEFVRTRVPEMLGEIQALKRALKKANETHEFFPSTERHAEHG
jgi:enterochelin esterase-like enzyme